jgi:hypothetical protein
LLVDRIDRQDFGELLLCLVEQLRIVPILAQLLHERLEGFDFRLHIGTALRVRFDGDSRGNDAAQHQGGELAAGLLSGLAPALRAGGDSLVASLRERGGMGFCGVRLRKAIVTLQVAFSLILLIGAALFLRTLTSLLAKGPGFDTSSLLSFAIAPTQNG